MCQPLASSRIANATAHRPACTAHAICGRPVVTGCYGVRIAIKFDSIRGRGMRSAGVRRASSIGTIHPARILICDIRSMDHGPQAGRPGLAMPHGASGGVPVFLGDQVPDLNL
eukprot:SAG31_NODE_2322_length_5941_cov_4.156624_6_plen_113_part_00